VAVLLSGPFTPVCQAMAVASNGTLTSGPRPLAPVFSRIYDNDFRISNQSVNGANTVGFTYDNDGLLMNETVPVLTVDRFMKAAYFFKITLHCPPWLIPVFRGATL
jgi:hypothetical protein